jgi:hypothetical protein
MNNGNRPKLELQLNESAKVKLLKDKCYEGTNTNGTYYLYTVEHNEAETAFFAPAEIHELIVKHALKSGDEFTLTKVASQNGKKVGSRLEFSMSSNGKPHAEITGDGFRAVMEQSLKEAVDITKSITTIPFQNEDVQKIASCLFIARTKTNGHSS